MNIRISAIICTLNRADYLCKAIQSLIEQTLPKEEYEILIVDNGSTDNTKQIVQENFLQYPNLRYIYEPIMGLSQARNTGCTESVGEYVVYLDDDAIASPSWLENIVKNFDSVKPSPVCVGGKIFPIWEIPKPDWLTDEEKSYFGVIDYGPLPKFLKSPEILFGSNMALKREFLIEVNGFNTDVGRKGKLLLSNEDFCIFMKLYKLNHPIYYYPDIIVSHLAPKERLNKKWLYKRSYWQGRSDAILINNKKEAIISIIKSVLKLFIDPVGIFFNKRITNLYASWLFKIFMIFCYRYGKLMQLFLILFKKKNENTDN